MRDATDVLVIGAGPAGLLAARRLAESGLRVTVLDKGRVPGGRLSTRAVGAGRADQGAQFFTVRDAAFAELAARWLGDGLIFEWSRGWSDGSLAASASDGFPRYAARGGFGALAGLLAAGLDVVVGTRLVALGRAGGRWRATSDDGWEWTARAALLTPPVPQSLALLAAGGADLPREAAAGLAAVAYAPCLCGLFAVAGETALPEPGAVQRPDADISWIADNRRKGISPEETVVTVHSGPAAGAAWWAEDDAAALERLAAGLRPFLARGSEVRAATLKRWRYAAPTTLFPARALALASPGPLAFAGDAFDGPRVEGAALSGWAAADALRGLI